MGLQSIDHFITYSVIAANPALSYSSVVSTVRCWAITSGPHEGSTYVQWTGNFSSDADAGERKRFISTRPMPGLPRLDFSKARLLHGSHADCGDLIGVIEDARFKRKEALAGLAAAAMNTAKK